MRAVLAVLFALVAVPTFGEEKANKAKKPEPKYEGKPLGYWVSQFLKGDTPEQRLPAVAALRSFGPDAAPALPTFTEMLLDHSEAYRLQVLSIVKEIGPAAKDVRPILLKMLKNKKTSPTQVVEALVAICPEPKDAVLALTPLLGDSALDCRHAVYQALCDIGPAAKDAIPAIRRFVIEQLTDNNPWFGFDLVPLRKLGPDVVPLLADVLDATSSGRHAVLDRLTEFGPKAAPAAPALSKLLKDENPHTRYRAAILLWKCAKDPSGVPVLAELLTQLPSVYFSSPIASVGPKDPTFLTFDAARELGEIGVKARAALPALRERVVTGLGAAVTSGARYGEQVADPELNALVMLGQAAEEAITKIEQGPKK
ncbi:HEAT repeat protein [Gemmata sp. SH-PL17]|uniref:HEAT repeat domain-containing protein n=1 Tax=Gemmata sp. SH-PL17 TaxID=1630693 RepID=UPI00078B5016|nr:HEAT repeat domain-containing protein [Gemmata sp. SH-PL17]AMV26600.1 HEAT repeat protein [Gemmata sp. SH-PL17]